MANAPIDEPDAPSSDEEPDEPDDGRGYGSALEAFEDEWTSRTSGLEDFHDEPGAGIDDARALQKTSVFIGGIPRNQI